MKNIFSIDLESWTHFYEDSLKIEKFSSTERKKLDNGYIKQATRGILDLLDKYKQKATFFIVAEIYDWYPGIIKSIRKRGHEIGYHTHTHLVVKNNEILEKEDPLSQKYLRASKPKGVSAPLIYLREDAMELLEKHGFTYSSSSYDDYHVVRYGSVREIPVSAISLRKQKFSQELPKQLTFKLLMNRFPIGGGLSIALIGSQTSRFIRNLNFQRKPAILFIHPWQLYQTRKITSLKYKLNLLMRNPLCLPYVRNINKDIEKLFKSHEFTSFYNYFDEQQRLLGQ